MLKMRLLLLKKLMKSKKNHEEKGGRESQSLCLKRLKKRKKWDLPFRTT